MIYTTRYGNCTAYLARRADRNERRVANPERRTGQLATRAAHLESQLACYPS